MTSVLHVQTRAYPSSHLAVADLEAPVPLDDGLTVAAGRLGSLAYREQRTLEIDVTNGLLTTFRSDEIDTRWIRARVLTTGAMLVTTASVHHDDLAALDVYSLADLDAEIDRARRRAESQWVDLLLDSLNRAGFVTFPPSSPARHDTGAAAGLEDPVRFNCHVLATRPQWTPSSRVLTNGRLDDSDCTVLLPYTFAWSLPPDTRRETILTELEGADLALAQRVVLADAMGHGLGVLDSLARDLDDVAPLTNFQAQLDRIRATYHRLDSYRYDSSQRSRSVYLATREEMDLDAVHGRTEALLDQAMRSLAAASNRRSIRLDRRLNRFVAVLASVTASVFVLDLISFIAGGYAISTPVRIALAATVVVASAATVIMVLTAGVRRRRRAGVKRKAW